jgi:signal peptidase I
MKKWLKDNRGFLVFLLCFGVFRTAIADWNPVPTGSMRPTILEGDVVWVDRLAYDLKLPLTDIALARLGQPQRGDVVTFTSPKDGVRLIKRLVAVPGDTVAVVGGVLHINGVAARYEAGGQTREIVAPGVAALASRAVEQVAGHSRTVQSFEGIAPTDTHAPVQVPADHYFMMGDNRDNSIDSRYWGLVPRHLLIGRAGRVVVSVDITDGWGPRWQRIGSVLR